MSSEKCILRRYIVIPTINPHKMDISIYSPFKYIPLTTHNYFLCTSPELKIVLSKWPTLRRDEYGMPSKISQDVSFDRDSQKVSNHKDKLFHLVDSEIFRVCQVIDKSVQTNSEPIYISKGTMTKMSKTRFKSYMRSDKYTNYNIIQYTNITL